MRGENGVPVTPEWSLPPRDCERHDGLCETPQHCTWLHGENADTAMIVRGEN